MGRSILPPKVKVGETFGKWVVTEVKRIGRYYKATCLCSCGSVKLVRQDSLLSGDSTSCGCFAAERASEQRTTHGLSSHRLYDVWYSMNRRCLNENAKDYKHYGGRGIKVCEDWNFTNPKGFCNFLADMAQSFVEGLELDRIDNNGGYSKSNCKWSTRSEQVINRRFVDNQIGRPRILNDGEDELHLAAMAEKYNLSPSILQERVSKLGMSLAEALTLPVKTKKYFLIFEGIEYDIKDVFVCPPNFLALVKKCKVSTEDFIYYLFGSNVLVEGIVNKKRITFAKATIDLSSYTFKLPRVSEDFTKHLANEYHHKEYIYGQ